MQHKDALQRVRTLLRRQDGVQADTASLSGPTLLDQEPDLAKEAAKRNLAFSAWAAGGQPTD